MSRPIVEGRAAFVKVRKLLDEAHAVAYAEVERRARQALRNKPGWAFCMAMGSASFYRPGVENDWSDEPRRWMASTLNFISEYDEALKLTGTPLKLTSATGPRLTDW